ncbi:MAG: DUF4168 domain-containing protein [Roseinatronobacter sp.]
MTLNRFLTTTATVAMLAAAPLVAGPALAQAQMNGAAIAADESKIDAFIETALAVSEARAGYMAQLEAATDQMEQMAIIEAADASILQIVEDAPNITLDEYIAIGEAAMEDPELAARIDARFNELAGES